MPIKQTQNQFIEKSEKLFSNLDYSKVNYIDSRTQVILICKLHGEFKIKPKDHICYKRGCSVCSGVIYNKITFLSKCKIVHEDKYIYDEVIYSGIKNKIIIRCRIHGAFTQSAEKHMCGQGCPKCKKSSHKNIEYVITMGNSIHNNKYDYSKSYYVLMFDKMEIICKIHGSFWQTPANHINHKQGCPRCAVDNAKLTINEFIDNSLAIHGDRFDYSKSIYINSNSNIEIICKIHGSFWQKAAGHMAGNGCQKCYGTISKKESQWLNYMNIPTKYRNKIISSKKRNYRVDAYIPETNTIYEFYGDYWHGNPKVYHHGKINNHNKRTFKSLYNKTIKREKELLKLGYKIIAIWECDFNKLIKSKNSKLDKRTKAARQTKLDRRHR